MKRKQGISLIVLVITIIVMIILAASVVLTLNNTGIITKANDATSISDRKQIENLAALAWSEAYLEGLRGDALKEAVIEKLDDYKDRFNIDVTDTGVNVTDKDVTNDSGSGDDNGDDDEIEIPGQLTSTLGDLVKDATYYGSTVNYEANGITDWKVLYSTDDYVYLITSEKLAYSKVPTSLESVGMTISKATVTFFSGEKREVGQAYWASEDKVPTEPATIQRASLWMANWNGGVYNTTISARCISHFLNEDHWTSFKNTTASYGSYVVGAIGTPTAEMLTASWNAKRAATQNTTIYAKEIFLTPDTGWYMPTDNYGYFVHDGVQTSTTMQEMSYKDDLYLWCVNANANIWMAAPCAQNTERIISLGDGTGIVNALYTSKSNGFRPVVCLNANIPAGVGTTTDFIIE